MNIAMKCSQEQFDAIKDKLTNCDLITNFDKVTYLVNCYRQSIITNLSYEYANAWADESYEEWNEQTFLKACGIEIEKVFKGSELQYKYHRGLNWIDIEDDGKEYRIKPDYSKEIAELDRQIEILKNK